MKNRQTICELNMLKKWEVLGKSLKNFKNFKTHNRLTQKSKLKKIFPNILKKIQNS
jgi:hypothetical protein